MLRNGWKCLNCETVWVQRRPPFECEVCCHRRGVHPRWQHLKAPTPPNTKRAKRGSVTPSRREFIYARDGFRCLACGETNRDKLTLDHILPKCRGGDNSIENLQTLCRACNCLKANRYPLDLKELTVQPHGVPLHSPEQPRSIT